MKYIWIMLCLLSVNVLAQETVFDEVSFGKSRILFVNASDENLKVMGIKKEVFDKFVAHYYAEESEILKDEFKQKLLIAPTNGNNIYYIILDSSLNCGSVGCQGKIFEIDTTEHTSFIKTDGMFDCTSMNETVSYCVRLQN